jgi:serine/threonine protein kinase
LSTFTGPLLAGRWKLGPRIGRGAQAETFLAQDQKDRREVVVKRLLLRGQWKSFDLFEREAKVLSQLRHPAVPRHIATVEEPPGTFNLVMQYMPGENLRELTARRRLSELELRDVLVRTLEILDHLHSRVPPIVHRDIKPSNLVRASDGKVALVDFGGVLEAAREKGGSTIVGTFGYMAPEQLHGQATAATDLYSLGATIVALGGGVEPEDVPRKGLRMDLAKHLPAMDKGLRAALDAMTEPDPEKRPQRARDVMAILAKGRSKLPAPPPIQAVTAPAQRRPARRMFRGVPEPLGTLLRLTVLAAASAGWLVMVVLQIFVRVFAWVFARRGALRAGTREVHEMLQEGREGFSDLVRQSVATTSRRALPPGE